MPRVVQIDGAPGTGKTHTLKQKLKHHRDDGLDVTEFYWLTFTRAGREDVEPELRDVFQTTDADPGNRARTFHSLSLGLAGANGIVTAEPGFDPIISQSDDDAKAYYREFCEREGLGFDERYSDPRKLLAGDKTTSHTGNLLFAVNDYLTQTCKPPEQHAAAPVDIPIPSDNVIRLLERWDDYKRTAADYRLFEHGDYVEEVYNEGVAPDVRLLLVDEFQDLAPLEYRLYKLWRDSGQLESVYIAGDPNQSIYSFRGGTPYYFEETAVDDRINLKTSRRCPSEVAAVGTGVLAAHAETDPQGFEGRESGGISRFQTLDGAHGLRAAVVEATERYPSADPSVFLLTRTRRQRYQLMRELQGVGVPFEVLGRAGSVWQGELEQLKASLESWHLGGDTFAKPNVRKLAWNLPDAQARWDAIRDVDGTMLERESVAPVFAGYEDALAVVEQLQLPSWKRDVLKNAVDAPASIQAKEVRVGTIHTAKGLEAPCVYLFGSTTENLVRRYSRNPDFAAEEHRVYYVGATRASEELYLVTDYFDGPTSPPLEKARRRTGAVV